MTQPIVCGGRDYIPSRSALNRFRQTLAERGIPTVHHGDARGVDRYVGKVCETLLAVPVCAAASGQGRAGDQWSPPPDPRDYLGAGREGARSRRRVPPPPGGGDGAGVGAVPPWARGQRRRGRRDRLRVPPPS